MYKVLISAMMAVAAVTASAAGNSVPEGAKQHRTWVKEMKSANRGPFSRIRWFCEDGQVLPPEPYACKEFGGGSQHGEWSERTLELRNAGYQIANFYADLDIAAFIAAAALDDRFAQMLIEQFLVRVDDGWILRKARYYRGAFQEEGERRGARKLLFKLAEDKDWITHRYLQLRTAASLLAHGAETASVQEIRQLSASLSDRDQKFKPLRNKIHGSPELADAAAVRAYLAEHADSEHREELLHLASLIEQVFGADIDQTLRQLAENVNHPVVVESVGTAIDGLANATGPTQRMRVLAQLLFDLRRYITQPNGPRQRIAMIDASLAVESEYFTTARDLDHGDGTRSRREVLDLLQDQLRALHGVGLLTKRLYRAGSEQVSTIAASPTLNARDYKDALDYLALVPNWGTQALRRYFGVGMDKLTVIEPKAALFIQDHLRGSPMFYYAELIDDLVRDANGLIGVRNELFGENVGAGLRSLNAGYAHGLLYLEVPQDIGALDRDGIYLLPETVSELPPVAGILTQGEGNPLSHVQLLARNLGIPNVGVDLSLLERLAPHHGKTVALAVSPAGSVRMTQEQPLSSEANTQTGSSDKPLIEVNLDKLNLEHRDFTTLSELRAADSGRVVGPKAAKLGELKHHYPEAVAEGLAIPFGAFRELLDAPYDASGHTIFDWMRAEYARLGQLPHDSAARRNETETFRAELQNRILNADPGTTFRERLTAKLAEVFGADGTFGVFVRSDTNVEDLPGFTGAGLNLTVANVVGTQNIIEAVSRVWASPFSARSFAWRQSLMDKPEHVYPAVLLMLSVDADKSGVLVTQDIDSGSTQWLSVAVNEGVGGAVDGQSAESLRIRTSDGAVRLLAEATAPIRRQVDLSGGVQKIPVSHADRVLRKEEISQLITLAHELPDRFPAIVDAAGRPAPADIEFGFLDGELRLFQIRPFLDSDQAQANALLQQLDAPLSERGSTPVDLTGVLQ